MMVTRRAVSHNIANRLSAAGYSDALFRARRNLARVEGIRR